MLATAGAPDAMGTRDVSARPLLSAAAGAKSREEPGQERPRAAWKREHGSDEPFGRTQDESERPARLARREAKSELAQIRAHHGFVHSDRTRTRQRASSPSGHPIAPFATSATLCQLFRGFLLHAERGSVPVPINRPAPTANWSAGARSATKVGAV